jgi:hypothetical protein
MYAQCQQCDWDYSSDHAYNVFDHATGHNETTNHEVEVK